MSAQTKESTSDKESRDSKGNQENFWKNLEALIVGAISRKTLHGI
jgi:hypothetical protein